MSELKVSVSGIRGIWGQSLSLDTLADYTQAFGQYILSGGGSRVLIGRDARPTGRAIVLFCSGILNSMGIEVIDCGIVPTPTVLFGVRSLGLDGGLIITASHNPIEWNALKFVKKGGVFTGEKDLKKILDNLGKPVTQASYDRTGGYFSDDKVSDLHIEQVLKNVDVDLIGKKRFKVVFDPVNSAGSIITPWLFMKLKCELQAVNTEINGGFGRPTEPTPENLTHLTPVVREFGADVGFAQDPDADRLVLVDEKGTPLSEELTLALALEGVLSRRKGDVVVNMSTSRMAEDIAAKYGGKVTHSKVGEANVVEEIERSGALIGGEGNGGVIYPQINTARDSLAGIALILELMARKNKPLSEIVAELPAYVMRKDKIGFSGDLNQLYDRIKSLFSGAKVNELDGLRLDWEENGAPVWVHIRPSNTEPIVRIIGEGSDKTLLDGVFEKIRSLT